MRDLRVQVALLTGATAAMLTACGGVASADGPLEPNETVASASAIVTADAVVAALETPQDVDWYRFYVEGDRQVGVLATLDSPCVGAYGTVRVELLDGEQAYGGSLGRLIVGRDYGRDSVLSAARLAFTSQRGHRYFLKVTQNGCQGAAYSLQLAPADALRSTMEPTSECAAARGVARRTERRLDRLRAAVQRARASRRSALRAKASLFAQQLVGEQAAADATCTRRQLTSYPFA